MIETRLLRQFVAVAEELHFGRAAQRLHMAQPPLSQAIRKLEQALGASLFTRSRRDVALTAAGRAFLDTARRTLLQLNEGAEHARRIAAGLLGQLSITFIDTAHFEVLPQILQAFRAQSPDIELSLREATTIEQVDALRTGAADVGFMRWPGLKVPDLTFERLAREPVLVALPSHHPEAGKDIVRLANLALDDFIATPRREGPGFHDQLIGLCRAAGFSPRIVQEAMQMQTAVGLVSGGLGVALVPGSLARAQRCGVVFRPIEVDTSPDMTSLDLVIAWLTSKTSLIRDNFLLTARHIAGDMPKVSL